MSIVEKKTTTATGAPTTTMQDNESSTTDHDLTLVDNDLEQAEEFQDEEGTLSKPSPPNTSTSTGRRRVVWMVGFCVLIPVAAIALALAVMASRRGGSDDDDAATSLRDDNGQEIVISASGYRAFTNTEQLYDAVDAYLLDNSSQSEVARTYGWPIGTWDVSRLVNFDRVFDATPFGYQSHDRYMRSNTLAANFNEDLSGWDTSRAVSMSSMFDGAAAFNQNLTTWDVSNVVSFQFMFHRATAFNGNVSNWQTSSAKTMWSMFDEARDFNSDISAWDVSNVESFETMFYGARSFSHSLCEWGPRIQELAFDSLVTMFLLTETCPESGETPLMNASPPGPFCFICE